VLIAKSFFLPSRQSVGIAASSFAWSTGKRNRDIIKAA